MEDWRIAAARRVQARIRHVLLERWDPLEIAGDPALHDEYDACIGPLYRLIATGTGPLGLAAELAEAERRMGRTTPPRDLLPVARALWTLDVRLEAQAEHAP